MGLDFVPGPGNAIFESREADSPWEPRRSGRRAWLAPRAGCAPPRRRGRGVAAALGPPGSPAAPALPVASAHARVGAHAHASPRPQPRPARDPAPPGPACSLPPAPHQVSAARAPPPRPEETPGHRGRRVRQSARAFAARPGTVGAGRRPARPRPPAAPRPAPSPLGSRRSVPAASGGAGRPGRSRVRAARKLARGATWPPSEHAQCRPQAAPAGPAGRDGPARRAGGGRPERPAGRPRPHPGPVRSASSPRATRALPPRSVQPRVPSRMHAGVRAITIYWAPTVCPALSDFMLRNVKQPALNKYLK